MIEYHRHVGTGSLKAVCFDLDGLLVDTERHYYESHRRIWEEYGAPLTREYYARTWIIRGTKFAAEVAKSGIKADPAELLERVRKEYRALVAADLKLMPRARETLEAAKRIGGTALVTNTPRPEAEMITERAGIRGLLDRLITREKYEKSKPAPDCYLAACRELGAAPAEVLALEDAPRGVRAAAAAGVACVAVVNEMTRYEQPEGAFLVLNSLAELDLPALAARWPPAGARAPS